MRSVLLVLALLSPAAAEPANDVGVSITGFLGLLRINVGSYAVSYERHLDERHAVRLAGDFLHVHHAAEYVQSHQWTFGGSAGYRYYVWPSVFLGGELGYRRGFGHYGDRDAPEHTALRNRQRRALAEVGVRQRLGRLSFVVRVGAGYGPYTVTSDRMDETGRAAVQLSRDNLAVRSLVVEAELAIGWSF